MTKHSEFHKANHAEEKNRTALKYLATATTADLTIFQTSTESNATLDKVVQQLPEQFKASLIDFDAIKSEEKDNVKKRQKSLKRYEVKLNPNGY